MKNPSYIEFVRTETPGPYGIPLKISSWGEKEILFDIDIDGITHSFPLKRDKIVDSMTSFSDDTEETTLVACLSIDDMARLYSKISAVVKSEKNQFII